MRTLDRNKRKVYYANITGVQELTDVSGNYTGEYAPLYGTPVEAEMYVSTPRGNAFNAEQGRISPYVKKLISEDIDDINESTVFWIDAPITAKHDYIVQNISKSLNHVSITIERVYES